MEKSFAVVDHIYGHAHTENQCFAGLPVRKSAKKRSFVKDLHGRSSQMKFGCITLLVLLFVGSF